MKLSEAMREDARLRRQRLLVKACGAEQKYKDRAFAEIDEQIASLWAAFNSQGEPSLKTEAGSKPAKGA